MILKELFDHEYPNNGFSNFRTSVRGVIIKDDKIGLLKIECIDGFGKRNHYETPGGGLLSMESRELGLCREIKEETGITIVNPKYIGSIIDRWNLMSRINMHHYYVCHYHTKESFIQNEDELLIKGIEWKSLDDFLTLLQEPSLLINKMIHERELIVLNKIKEIPNL